MISVEATGVHIVELRGSKGRIAYTTFHAPANTVDVLRLAFAPRSVTADGRPLAPNADLDANDYRVKKLACGDSIVWIRDDGGRQVVIEVRFSNRAGGEAIAQAIEVVPIP